jgi:hypothetical protein
MRRKKEKDNSNNFLKVAEIFADVLSDIDFSKMKKPACKDCPYNKDLE